MMKNIEEKLLIWKRGARCNILTIFDPSWFRYKRYQRAAVLAGDSLGVPDVKDAAEAVELPPDDLPPPPSLVWSGAVKRPGFSATSGLNLTLKKYCNRDFSDQGCREGSKRCWDSSRWILGWIIGKTVHSLGMQERLRIYNDEATYMNRIMQ